MIVLMAGLPGSGKSTLARELAARTSGVVLDKDVIRAAIFAPEDIEYSTAQDDFCQEIALQAAAYLLKMDPTRIIFLDGRPFSRKYQMEAVLGEAERLRQPWRILECICSESAARQRLESSTGEHLAANRNFDLYLRVKAGFEAIAVPRTLLDTEQSLAACIQQALAALR